MPPSSNIQKLIHAYDHMMQRVRADLEQAPADQAPNVEGAIQRAAYLAIETGELTEEEAHLLAGYMQRDLKDAGSFLAATGEEDLGQWLRFDLGLIEDRFLDLFQAAADKTRLQMLAFEEDLERRSHYHTGEITAPGTLQCDNCGKQMNFHAVAHIPPCPGCRKTVFTRLEREGS